jgi:hypothetical protein
LVPLVTPAIIFAAIALVVGAILLFRHPSYTSAALFTFLLLSVAGTGIDSLGQPKPFWAAYPKPQDPTIVGFVLDGGHAIYVWLQTDGPPVAYALPWSEPEAAQLHDAAEAAKAAGVPLKGKLVEGKPGEPGTKDNEKILAYPAPQPPLPPKAGEG